MGWLLGQKALGKGIMWPLGSFQQLKSFDGWCIFPERQRPCRQPTVYCSDSAATCKPKGRAGHSRHPAAAKQGGPRGIKRRQPSSDMPLPSQGCKRLCSPHACPHMLTPTP